MPKKFDVAGQKAQVINDPRDESVSVFDATQNAKDELAELTQWVLGRLSDWESHRKSNYEPKWDEQERLWRGIWSGTERQRKSERSKIMTPALSEAVENCVSELEEAVFGRGDFFDAKGQAEDQPELKAATERNKNNLKEDLEHLDFAHNCSEALVNGAVFGSGIGEILVEEKLQREVAPETDAAGNVTAKLVSKTYVCAPMRSVNPRNFLIDPVAKTVDEGLGCAVEEYVEAHKIKAGQTRGEYRDVEVGTDAGKQEISTDPQVMTEYTKDKTHVYRYYGLVPRHLLLPPDKTVDLFPGDAPSDDPVKADMVEAVIVIANKSTCIKAIENPFIMSDRPIIAFPWDIVPGRFWGRGVCEKGATPSKLLDAEYRSRMDALAYTGAPMVAIDAARLPRGFKFEVAPGKTILTNGDPNTVLKPFKFGEVDQTTFQQTQALDQMIQRATGALDSVSMATRGGDARPGAVSMQLSGIMKRHKRTLMSFIDRFLVPALRKIMWRHMQYSPERYTPLNFSFVASSTTGIMQREYESQQLTQLLNTMEPQSKEYKMVLMGILANSGLQHRVQLIQMLKTSIDAAVQSEQAAAQAAQAQGVDPLQAQLQQTAVQLEIAEKQAKIAELNSQAALNNAKARAAMIQPEIDAREVALKGVYNTPQEQMQAEFDRRMKIGDQIIAQEDIASNERIANAQSNASIERERVKAGATVAAAAQPEKIVVREPQPVPVPVPVPVRPLG